MHGLGFCGVGWHSGVGTPSASTGVAPLAASNNAARMIRRRVLCIFCLPITRISSTPKVNLSQRSYNSSAKSLVGRLANVFVSLCSRFGMLHKMSAEGVFLWFEQTAFESASGRKKEAKNETNDPQNCFGRYACSGLRSDPGFKRHRHPYSDVLACTTKLRVGKVNGGVNQ
jgi:hypothetical protein